MPDPTEISRRVPRRHYLLQRVSVEGGSSREARRAAWGLWFCWSSSLLRERLDRRRVDRGETSCFLVVTLIPSLVLFQAVIALRRLYPEKSIFARAKDADHAKRLQTTLDVAAMVPILPEDNRKFAFSLCRGPSRPAQRLSPSLLSPEHAVLLTLPFAGAVLRSLGSPAEEVNYILAEKRREVLSGKELERFEEETVLAQLGVEKPEGKAKEAAPEDDVAAAEVAEDFAAEGPPPSSAVAEPPAPDGDAGSAEVREAAKPKEPEALKPLVKQVVEANVSLEQPKKKEAEPQQSEEAEVEAVEAVESAPEADGEEEDAELAPLVGKAGAGDTVADQD